MRICHVTPHLPPDQAANALLPFHLGWWSREAGDEVTYLAHPPRLAATDSHARPGSTPQLAGPVTWIPVQPRRNGLGQRLKLGSLIVALRIARQAGPLVAAVDLVHVHSNGLLAEIAALLAVRARKPVVLTLYGTEIWHYQPRRWQPDLFTRAYRAATHVTFYSQGLQARATELGLARPETSVIYPPVAEDFRQQDTWSRAAGRAALGLHSRHVLVNVKRLHPLAGQRYLIEAVGEVIRHHPDTRLVICGTGPLLDELRDVARAAGVEAHVIFRGLVDNRTVSLYDAVADAFVLPSLLEACPTVALEALACGTPVISSDNPGGVELSDLFGLDVQIVPRENALALADAITDLLDAKRRVRPATTELIEREFRPPSVARRFFAVYRRALDATGRGA